MSRVNKVQITQNAELVEFIQFAKGVRAGILIALMQIGELPFRMETEFTDTEN